ncbi:MAG TPA: hypothetical protein VGA32_01550, partial [Anaerolineales bacterium]
QQLLADIRAGVVSRMFRFQVRPSQAQPQAEGRTESTPAAAPSMAAGPVADDGGEPKRRRRRRHR